MENPVSDFRGRKRIGGRIGDRQGGVERLGGVPASSDSLALRADDAFEPDGKGAGHLELVQLEIGLGKRVLRGVFGKMVIAEVTQRLGVDRRAKVPREAVERQPGIIGVGRRRADNEVFVSRHSGS